MKNIFKTTIVSLLLSILFCCSAFSGNMTSGYFVVPTDYLNEQVQEQLGNKIKTALSKAGVSATDGYFPMVTIVKYDEIETIEISGIRKMFRTMGDVSIMIVFEHTNTVLASTSVEVKGVGVSRKVSQSKAVRNIKIPQKEITDLLEKAEKNYASAIEAFGKKRLAEAKKLNAQGHKYKSLEVASEIPQDCKSFDAASKLIDKINKETAAKRKENQKRRDKKEERDHELRKKMVDNENERIKQSGKNRREQIKANADVKTARAKVSERYYRAWESYYRR